MATPGLVSQPPGITFDSSHSTTFETASQNIENGRRLDSDWDATEQAGSFLTNRKNLPPPQLSGNDRSAIGINAVRASARLGSASTAEA